MVGSRAGGGVLLRPKIILSANFKFVVLSRYLELCDRSRYFSIANSCSLLIPHKKTTVADSQTKKKHRLSKKKTTKNK